MVQHDYDGCRKQYYGSHVVEWCFCRGKAGRKHEPCNKQSRDDIAKMAPGSVVSSPGYPDRDYNYVPVYNKPYSGQPRDYYDYGDYYNHYDDYGKPYGYYDMSSYTPLSYNSGKESQAKEQGR